jgi:hypothetical protein
MNTDGNQLKAGAKDLLLFDEALSLLTHVQNKHLLQEAERKRRGISEEKTLLTNSPAAN